MILHTTSAEQTERLGEYIGSRLNKGDVIAFQGTLAAGKTTMTKGIARGLGIDENVTSPTFTLISEYRGRLPLYHMDVYRLDSNEDFVNLGVEELLYGDGVCVVEWSEKVMPVLPPSSMILLIEGDGEYGRKITVTNWPYGDFPDEYTRD